MAEETRPQYVKRGIWSCGHTTEGGLTSMKEMSPNQFMIDREVVWGEPLSDIKPAPAAPSEDKGKVAIDPERKRYHPMATVRINRRCPDCMKVYGDASTVAADEASNRVNSRFVIRKAQKDLAAGREAIERILARKNQIKPGDEPKKTPPDDGLDGQVSPKDTTRSS